MANKFDRFTLLPNSLLLIIISFLHFKKAVRTSILSKHWFHQWEKATNIEFNKLCFVKLNQPHQKREIRRRDLLRFITFWLDNNKELVVEKFSLKLSMLENAHYIIESWNSNEFEIIGNGLRLRRLVVDNCLFQCVDETLLDVDYQRIWTANVTVYECLISTLKVVEVNDFRGTVNGLLVLYYLIRCGRILKKVNINVPNGEVEDMTVEMWRLP
ncbi:F-box/LRR-repeat protein At3g58900-like [Gastrolobium bilobum]|uniref:F-box/LRR-repeat protein At3g58900-like n=1 Tax=Gastrolobium bilobum TaxID=150636 RepID=UPI002AB23D0E|nr:F-box/LRR-repeat protein At3g58900-like [Gastrolobium bilobum]